MSQNQNPTPIEVIKLLELIQRSKPYYIAYLLECTGDQAVEISRAFDQYEFVTLLHQIRLLGDAQIALGVQKMKEAQ